MNQYCVEYFLRICLQQQETQAVIAHGPELFANSVTGSGSRIHLQTQIKRGIIIWAFNPR